MTLFEYITVAVSMVLSLSVIRAVGGIGHALDPARRYGVHTAWCALKGFQPLVYWWTVWSLHDQEGWNFLAFALLVVWPVLLYLQISTLVPDDAKSVPHWREHFHATRTRFFAAEIAMSILGPFQLGILSGLRAAPALVLSAIYTIPLGVIGIRSGSERVHVALVTAWLLLLIGWIVLLFVPTPVGEH